MSDPLSGTLSRTALLSGARENDAKELFASAKGRIRDAELNHFISEFQAPSEFVGKPKWLVAMDAHQEAHRARTVQLSDDYNPAWLRLLRLKQETHERTNTATALAGAPAWLEACRDAARQQQQHQQQNLEASVRSCSSAGSRRDRRGLLESNTNSVGGQTPDVVGGDSLCPTEAANTSNINGNVTTVAR
eukprot:PhM_4_TR6834/c0_g1_i1/m.79962